MAKTPYLTLVLFLAAWTIAGLVLLSSSSSQASPSLTERVSIASDGTQGNEDSFASDITPDGRFVTFTSYASNLVPGDTNNTEDIFLRDRTAGTTTRVSVGDSENQANALSSWGTISANGRYVAFSSTANNLVPNDADFRDDIYVRDLVNQTTTLVSTDAAGNKGNAESVGALISPDGRFISFSSVASNLVPGDSNTFSDTFIRDRDTDDDGIFDEPGMVSNVRISVDSNGGQANGNSYTGWISSDLRFVVFDSWATNLVAGDNNNFCQIDIDPELENCPDIFVRDRDTDGDGVFDEAGAVSTTRVSLSSAGAEGNCYSQDPRISQDGRFIFFESCASNLVSGDTNGLADVFMHDRQTGTTTRVSVSSSGAQGDRESNLYDISPNGRFILFDSNAANLVAGDTNDCGSGPGHCGDVFVRDRVTQITTRVSVDSAGNQANAVSGGGDAITSSGGVVAFSSHASNLVVGDTNICPRGPLTSPCSDAFVHELSDLDSDGEFDPFDPCPTVADCDNDAFGDGAERSIGTNPLAACGPDAWPADINNDGFSDIADVSALTGVFGQAVPPAPARYNIAPDTPDGFVDITDVSRMTGLFGMPCPP